MWIVLEWFQQERIFLRRGIRFFFPLFMVVKEETQQIMHIEVLMRCLGKLNMFAHSQADPECISEPSRAKKLSKKLSKNFRLFNVK